MVARGSWQTGIWTDLTTGKIIPSPIGLLRGNARKYSQRYKNSFSNMLDRARDQGYTVARVPGVRGGEYTAKYMIISGPGDVIKGKGGRAMDLRPVCDE